MISTELAQAYGEHVAAQLRVWQGLLADMQVDGVLVAAGAEIMRFREDQAYPFKVNPYFKVWLPLLDRPDSYIWIDGDTERPLLLYFQPQDIWHKVEPLTDPAVLDAFEVVVCSDHSTVLQHLPALHYPAYIGAPQHCPFASARINPAALLTALDFRSAYKDGYQLQCLRRASARVVLGHRAAARAFSAGSSEYGIHMAYLEASGQLEEDLPYGNIIALNEHGAVLHYTQKSRQQPLQRRSFLIDAGASAGGYGADISRTYSASEDEFGALIEAMDGLQQQIIASIQVGASYVDLHLQAHRLLAGVLRDAGLVTCSAEVCLQEGLTSILFPHGLGHLLGLQVHERGGWLHSASGEQVPPPPEHPYLRLTRPIETGQVFTIEPGLYFIPELLQEAHSDKRARLLNWPLIEQLIPCGGIRIEDDIAITPEGVENLTRNAFAAADLESAIG
ncbi:MAG: Xaa-Pro dipeptidase [Gammaproteobacteria bacterium]|nr:Xaa-Pro dipeptidase [Gammaproteobacteria bacterium]